LSRDCRRVVTSDWYRRIFPTRLSPQRQAVPEFETTAQGCRIATSVGGVLTGRGADLINIDDPLKPEEALSDAHWQAANERFDHTLYSRLNDKKQGAIVLIMHRLHEENLVEWRFMPHTCRSQYPSRSARLMRSCHQQQHYGDSRHPVPWKFLSDIAQGQGQGSHRPTYIINRIDCSSRLALGDPVRGCGVRSIILYPAGQIWCSEM
jgi:hypothetical protein